MAFWNKDKNNIPLDEYDVAFQKAQKRKKRQKVWRKVRPVVVILLSAGIVVSTIAIGWNYANKEYFKPVQNTPGNKVTIEVKSGWGTSKIANALYGTNEDDQLIRNKALFKIYVDFVGKGRKLRAGKYTFEQGESMEAIVNKIAAGESDAGKTLRFTLTEGMTVEDMVSTLVAEGVLSNADEFLTLAKTGTNYEEYGVPTGVQAAGRLYALEGYLFPDTYEVFEGTTADEIIRRLLTRRMSVFDANDYERMEEMNLTEDQVITLASIIEKEARTKDFAKVSAVLHNRLRENMYLQSDATLAYALDISRITLTKSELETETPYNTHLNKGLPAGPISNPGEAALKAVLYPDEKTLEEGYYYFALKEPSSGELVFSKTLEEHQANVDKYQKTWKAFDDANASSSDSDVNLEQGE